MRVAVVIVLEDGAWIGCIDGSGGLCRRAVQGTGRAILDVRQRRMVGVGRQPCVDETLDDATAAKGRADEAPAALRVEILEQLRVARVALAATLDFGLDVRVGDDDPFLL